MHYRYLRMSKERFDHLLLSLVRAKIAKKNTKMRESISSEERLVITLRYLSQGLSQITVCCNFRVGRQTVSTIVKEVCVALHDILGPIYDGGIGRRRCVLTSSPIHLWVYPWKKKFKTFKTFKTLKKDQTILIFWFECLSDLNRFKPLKRVIARIARYVRCVLTRVSLWALWTFWTFWTLGLSVLSVLNPSEYFVQKGNVQM